MPVSPSAKKTLVLLALAALAAVLLVLRPDRPQALAEPPLPRVEVTTVQRADVRPTEAVSGRLQPARRSELRFEVAGRVIARRVEPGERVAAGAPLLEIEAGDYRDALQEAEAQLRLERANLRRDRRLLELAGDNVQRQRSEVERLASLNTRSMTSASQLDDARIRLAQLESDLARLQASVDTAEARLALRKAAVDRARRNLERTRLLAPFAGTVNAVRLEIGDYAAGGQVAAVLIDTAQLDFSADLRGSVVRSLELGEAVTVTIDGREHRGRVQAVQRQPDDTTFTHRVRVRLAGEGLQPGEMATAIFPLPVQTDARLIPVTAVLREEGRTFVFRVNGEGKLHKTPVELGRREGRGYVVLKGVAAGERIVARDVAGLTAGQTVNPVE